MFALTLWNLGCPIALGQKDNQEIQKALEVLVSLKGLRFSDFFEFFKVVTDATDFSLGKE